MLRRFTLAQSQPDADSQRPFYVFFQPRTSTLSRVPSFARRPLVLALAGLGFALLGYQFVPHDETRIAGVLERLCSQLNQTRDEASLRRLRQALPAALEPQIRLRIVELDEQLAGLPDVSARAQELLQGAPLTFALKDAQIQISGARARADADLLVTVSGSGEQRRDLRRTHVELQRANGAWLVERIEIEPVAPSEPEPRP